MIISVSYTVGTPVMVVQVTVGNRACSPADVNEVAACVTLVSMRGMVSKTALLVVGTVATVALSTMAVRRLFCVCDR